MKTIQVYECEICARRSEYIVLIQRCEASPVKEPKDIVGKKGCIKDCFDTTTISGIITECKLQDQSHTIYVYHFVPNDLSKKEIWIHEDECTSIDKDGIWINCYNFYPDS